MNIQQYAVISGSATGKMYLCKKNSLRFIFKLYIFNLIKILFILSFPVIFSNFKETGWSTIDESHLSKMFKYDLCSKEKLHYLFY